MNDVNKTPVSEQEVGVLLIAQELIHGQRQVEYGDTLTNFAQIAMMWQGYLAPKLRVTSAITPEDVAMCMILLKMARLSKSPDHVDSLVDIAGYAGCTGKLQAERQRGSILPGAILDSRNL
jgi:hypothetical protein